jgi:hypothetical protein
MNKNNLKNALTMNVLTPSFHSHLLKLLEINEKLYNKVSPPFEGGVAAEQL